MSVSGRLYRLHVPFLLSHNIIILLCRLVCDWPTHWFEFLRVWIPTLHTHWATCVRRPSTSAYAIRKKQEPWPFLVVSRKIVDHERLIYCWLIQSHSPVNCSGSPQGFSQIQISHTSWIQYKTCTLHKHNTNKHNPKGSPFGIALVKKKGGK